MVYETVSSFGDNKHAEMRSLVTDQTRDIATRVGDNLYSVYLRRLETGKPTPIYTDFPIKDPPLDKTFYMDEVEEGQEGEEQSSDPLINAFDLYFRRQVYKRIHNEGLEPIIEHTPQVGPAGVDLALKLRSILEVKKHLPENSTAFEHRRRILWTDLEITNERVRQRMQKLFPIASSQTSHAHTTYPKESRQLKKLATKEERTKSEQARGPSALVEPESGLVKTLQDKLNESIMSSSQASESEGVLEEHGSDYFESDSEERDHSDSEERDHSDSEERDHSDSEERDLSDSEERGLSSPL